jgi:hypothetical protein
MPKSVVHPIAALAIKTYSGKRVNKNALTGRQMYGLYHDNDGGGKVISRFE